MREIKFRAWNPVLNRMSYDMDLLSIGFQFSILRKSWSILNTVKGIDTNEILMQYTGLKDKNGKEIYEGDILRMGKLNPQIGKVIFHEGAFHVLSDTAFMSFVQTANMKQSEIIGNIYENPELINV